MSTKESPSLNNNRKLTASFSSPEFNESSLLSSSSMEGTSESFTSAATTTTTNTANNNNAAESLTSNTHLITTSNSNSMITSNTASQIISGAGIKLNTTRDSGFSDSLIEDSTTSSSNSTQFLTRSEHLVNTLIDAKIPPPSSSPVKLNSVDEDMHITNDEKDDELSKEFITIVKTTKVTTKVKHIKNPAKNKKNKKQKQQKGVVEQQQNIIDENKQLAEIVTEIITENESVLSANITGSNNLYTNGSIQSTSKTSKSITQTTSSSNGDNNKYDKIEEDEERTSNSAESNTNEIYDEEDEEDNQIAELNGINKSKSKNRKQKEDDTIIKLNINKSTEELVFQGLPPSTIIKTKEESLTTYSNNNTTTTNNTQQLLSTTMSSDLNTSILDSEELLSDYSTVQNPNQLETTLNKTNDLNASLTSSSIKEIPNVIDFVLNDVTNNEVKPVVQVSNETKNDNNKKKKKFNLFKSKSSTTTTTADSKRKLSKKDTDLVQESPSKQAKISKETAKNILSLYDHNSLSTVKHRILDEEQKDRIIYMKPECVDVLLNYFVQFESNSNSKTQLTNLKNQPYLSVALKKMIARSLDLLRHDKIETFDKLAAQLKQEYKISDLNEDEIVDENFDFNNVNSVTNDLIFKQLIQEALIHNKILLSIYLDKSKCQPYEEIIEFNNSNKLISNNLPLIINKPIQTPQIEEEEQEQEQDQVNKTEPEIIEVELKQTPPVEKEEVEVVVLKQESFEVKQEPIEIIQKQSEYESRIVLDTIKEPPIVFPSELDPSILSRPIIQSKAVENDQQQQQHQPTVSQSENKNKTKVKKIKKSSNKKTNSGISCIVCGTSSMKKSEEDLNKLTEIPIPLEEEKIIQPSKSPTEQHLQQSVDLEAVNQALFTNLDSKSSEIKVEEEEQQKDLKTEDLEKIKVSLEKLDLNDKQEQQLAVNNEIEKTTLTPPSTPEELNNLNQKEQTVEIIQPVIQLTDSKTTKKNKKQKKQKTQVTNEIHLSSTGLVDVSVLDVTIEASLDSVPKDQPIIESEKELEITNQILVEQPTAATTNTDPIKIDIKNIQMENEKTELERKSFSEIIEITHTFVSNLEKDNDIKIGSNLDIKTEIDIGIEKEILKEEVELVQLIEKQEKEQEQEPQQVKPPLSDDIVKLPERDESQLVSPLAVINTTTTTTTKVEVEATKTTKKEKKTPTSCFSCKAKKAKKETKIVKKETEQVKTVTPSLAVAEEESQTQVVIKEPTTTTTIPLNIKSTEPIHGNLFVGLDRRSSEQPQDVPSIYTIEMNEKQQTDSTKSHIGSIEKEEKLITPSLVGSTSIEDTQNENNNKVIQSDLIAEVQVEELEKNIQLELQTTNQTEITELHIEEQLVEDKSVSDLVAPPTAAAKEETVKVLSDDPVVLPEPSENIVQQPQVKSEIEIAKKENESQSKPDNKKVKNKKSTTSCFPKKQKKVVASPQMKEEKKETKTKAEPAESTQTKVSSAPVVHAENKIIENWSIGLDRKDDDIVLRKEPIDYITVVANEKLIHKEEEKLTEEIIVVSTEKVEEVTVYESQKLDENLAQSELIVNEIDVKSNLKEGSWVVIDRQPDHAVIPIVNNQENVPQQQQQNQQSSLAVLDTAPKVETTTAKIEEKPAKIKTSRIDLPLINLCAPRSKKDKKSKTKVKKTIKNDVTVLTLDTPEQPSASIITNEIAKIQPPVIETEQTIELEVKAIIDEAIKQIEHTTITEKPNEKIDEPVVHIKLDRIPDIVSLPEPSLDANTKTLAVEVKTTAEAKLEQPAVTEISTKSEKKEQKRTTSIFDMPLIDILVPNESKKREKSEKKLKKKNNKQTSATNVESTKKKEQIPELLIIDVPTLDIIKSQPETPVKKQEKVENFNIEIPVTETSVENLDIKIKEESQLKSHAKEEQEENLPIITSELKIETITEEITKTEELVATSNANEIDKTDETGSWIIIDRQSDHAVLPTVEVIQQTTVEQPITPIIEVKPIEEVKTTKIVKTSKKPISCFSCRAKNSKSKKETVKKDEPVVATETKTVEKVEVKPIVPVQTEFNYDFSGLDRRDSQEPLKKDPEPEQLKVEQESLQPETVQIVVEPLKAEPKEEIVELTIKDEPQVLETNENIEKLVSEELNQADNSVLTTIEVIQQSTVEEPITPSIETKPIEESNKEDNNIVLPAFETTEVIQQTTVEQPITPIIEVKPIEEVKTTKIVKTSKKPISCFSCRAKNSKSKKETVKKDEPVVATETKTVEKVEVKPIVPVQTEFNYDFSGLDRRDSQEPLKKDPEPITTVIDLTIKNEPQVLETNENIEKIIKEELNEVDKQYPELNKVVETTVTIENEQLKSSEEEDPTKSLDEILEKAEIELKKFDESLEIKPLKEAETEQLIKEQEPQQVKPPLSDDIVKLPERDESQLVSPLAVINTTTTTTTKVEVEATKTTKKEKKTPTSCFSCKAKKAKDNKEISNLTPKTQYANIETKTEPIAQPINDKPAVVVSDIKYDPDIFKGLDRAEDDALIKKDLEENLDSIRVERSDKPQIENTSEIIFNEVIQEIIVETSAIQQPVKEEEKVQTIQEKEPELVAEPVIETIKKDLEKTLEVSAAVTPRVLSDDPVVLPEPPVRTQTHIITKKVEATPISTGVETEKKAKKSGLFASLICSGKTKAVKKNKILEKSASPASDATEIKSVDLEIKTPLISAQPPKKPPRGHLDTSVVDNDIETLIPKNFIEPTAIIETKLVEEIKTPTTIVVNEPTNIVLDVSHVLIDPQITQPLQIEIQNPNVSLVQEIKTNEVLSNNSLLTESKLQTSKSESTLNKVLEVSNVIDLSSNVSKRITTWTTDPLPHVQIGSHRINFSETEVNNLVRNEQKTVSTVKTEPEISPKVEITTTTTNLTSETLKKLTKEEIKLLKSKKNEAIDYLAQKLGYSKSSSNTKQDKEKLKVVNKLFKKCIKTLLKNDSITFSDLNKKLEKEVSSKKYSTEINQCLDQFKQEITSDSLFNYLKHDKQTLTNLTETEIPKQQQQQQQQQITTLKTNDLDSGLKQKSSSDEKLDKFSEQQQPVMKRFPSLTWREANERARILFYKGRVPSIHYNEKRDSFRVSMITSVVNTNGIEKTTEVPVCDDDVRRLLNSCGLYWNGESISLLNKSDDIFSIAQQEAFDILQLINSSN